MVKEVYQMSFFTKTKKVNICESHHPIFQYFLMRELKTDIILTSDVNINDSIINVSAGHGFSIGEYIVLWSVIGFIQFKVKNVDVNAITVDAPCPVSFFITETKVIRGTIEMNLDFDTIGEKDYVFKTYNMIKRLEIMTVIITMRHLLPADDGKFGGIAALSKGILFRSTNQINANLGVYANNQDFKDRGANVSYTDSAPAGTYSTEIKFEIQDSFKQCIEIDSQKDEYLYAKLRDDLSDLNLMHISLIGSFTEGL
jgi:hypothetical protein